MLPDRPVTAPSTMLLDRLMGDGRITSDQYDDVLLHAQRAGEPVEEALLDLAILNETDLLKYLAALYKTKFVSTEKLAKADIYDAALEKVPFRVADKCGVCPILFDAKAHVLSIVARNLEDFDAVRQVQVVSGARDIRAYAARPSAVDALIRKFYRKEPHAFAALVRDAGHDLEVFEGRSGSVLLTSTHPVQHSRAAPPMIDAPGGFTRHPPPVARQPDYVAMMAILIDLLETERGDLRGHSSLVGRWTRKVCERLGVPEREIAGTVVAAHIHDLGKASSYHLTAFNVAQYDGHRNQAQKNYAAPAKLFDEILLPEDTAASVSHLYERWDGTGFPDRLRGEMIPLGARVIAVTETFADLTMNPKNPFRVALGPKEALEVITKLQGQVFDPAVISALAHVAVDDETRRRRGTKGIAGSLEELALPEMIQLLSHGKKSGNLVVSSHGRRGEIHFLEGQIHDATFGNLRGEDAFYEMLLLQGGEFSLDPAFRPNARSIHQSAETLLLEGMRRLDERGS